MREIKALHTEKGIAAHSIENVVKYLDDRPESKGVSTMNKLVVALLLIVALSAFSGCCMWHPM